MKTLFNYAQILILGLVVMAWFLGIWGIFGREVQLFNAFLGVMGILFTMIRFRGWAWKFLTKKDWDK